MDAYVYGVSEEAIESILKLHEQISCKKTDIDAVAKKLMTVLEECEDGLGSHSASIHALIEELVNDTRCASDIAKLQRSLMVSARMRAAHAGSTLYFELSDKLNSGSGFSKTADVSASAAPAKISTVSLSSLPDNVQKAYHGYESVGWKGTYFGQTPGTKAGGIYENRDNLLPSSDDNGNPIEYRKYDINSKMEGESRDKERYVRGSNGKLYYSSIHYKSFTEIRED